MLAWFKKYFWSGLAPEIVQARQLIAAIDKGGIPLNPIEVNAIARSLGLDVASSAPMEETIDRIRHRITR